MKIDLDYCFRFTPVYTLYSDLNGYFSGVFTRVHQKIKVKIIKINEKRQEFFFSEISCLPSSHGFPQRFSFQSQSRGFIWSRPRVGASAQSNDREYSLAGGGGTELESFYLLLHVACFITYSALWNSAHFETPQTVKIFRMLRNLCCLSKNEFAHSSSDLSFLKKQ